LGNLLKDRLLTIRPGAGYLENDGQTYCRTGDCCDGSDGMPLKQDRAHVHLPCLVTDCYAPTGDASNGKEGAGALSFRLSGRALPPGFGSRNASRKRVRQPGRKTRWLATHLPQWQAGATLVAVQVEDEYAPKVEGMMDRHAPTDWRMRRDEYVTSGWQPSAR
jgi:hypothetical protein